jgi:hypothetical protein
MQRHKALNLGAVVLVAFALWGCDSISGNLSVQQELHLPTDASSLTQSICKTFSQFSFCQNVAPQTIPAGQYAAELSSSSSQIEIKVTTTSKQTNKIIIKLPGGDELPNLSGSLSLSAAQAAIEYDVSGQVNTQESDGDETSGVQNCSYPVTQKVCHWTEGQKDQQCDQVTTYVSGSQNVTFHEQYTNKSVSIQLLEPGTSNVIATFQGGNDGAETIYDYQGPCS